MKSKIFDVLREEINLPTEDFIVVGSAVMAAHDIRDFADVDIIVNDRGWKELLERGWDKSPIAHRAGDKLTKGVNEAFADFRYGELYLTFENLKTGAEFIDGFPFITLKRLIEFKKAIGREKDLKDIKLIEDYLKMLK